MDATSARINITNEIQDSTRLCRLCMGLARNKEMKELFNSDTDNIVKRIQYCTGMELSKEDGMPSNICNVCVNNLSIAYNFKTACLASDKAFRSLLKQKIKTESPSYDDDNGIGDMIELGDVVGVKTECDDEILRDVKECNSTELVVKTKRQRRMVKHKFTRLKCEPCGLSFVTKQQSDEHKRVLHKDEQWICEICGKTFLHRASHYTHFRTHFPPKYSCDHCDHSTWHKHDLLKHLSIHAGIKRYQCEFCTSSYYTSSNLHSHIKSKHEGIKKYECPKCDKKFFDRTKLNRHVDTHNDIKRHECEVCHAQFSRRCHWKNHLLRQHSITVPPQRPGRQKTNFLIGEQLLQSAKIV